MLNLKANQMGDEISDIYISNSGRIPQELIQFTRDSGLFRNVVVINQHFGSMAKKYRDSSKLKFLYYICKAMSMLTGHRDYARILSMPLYSDKCDVLITNGLWSSAPYIVNYFYSQNSSLNLHIIDEGVGTRNVSFQVLTDPKHDGIIPSRFHKMIYDVIWFITTGHYCNKDISNFRSRVTDYYLYNPKKSRLYHETSLTPHKLLPFDSNNKLTPMLGKMIEEVDYEAYVHRKLWILSDYDVLEYHPLHMRFMKVLETTLSSFSQNNVILKGHPNLLLNEEYYSSLWPELYLDNRKYQLEALYSQIDLNNKILITRISSAVFYPKHMFNAEPYVIFTYKLSPEGVDIEVTDRLVNSLRELYENPLKIYVPGTEDELQNIICYLS